MNTNPKYYDNLGLIVAYGKNREIGYQNRLIWKISEDLNFFKQTTMNSYIIMGRKTYESMPKNLPGRKYIILSRQETLSLDKTKIHHQRIEETLSWILSKSNSNFWVVGGSMIYQAFLPYVSKMYITNIEDSFQKADAFFPEYQKENWQLLAEEQHHIAKNNLKYSHLVLIRKK